MRLPFTRGGVSAACIVLAVSTVSSAELSRYREFELGATVATVTAVTQNAARLTTVHNRPALLQQLEWRPRYMAGAPQPDRDSIGEVVFSFVDDQLFKMAIEYARDRTSGLTTDDMVGSLTAVYGAPSSPSPQRRTTSSAVALDAAVVIAEWRHADTTVVLQRKEYSESFFLVITSLPLDIIARKAQATAVAMDQREAPAREAALLKKQADDDKAAAETTRTANKKVFRP
ncbi:MAG TPA: hypothetical protein VKA59_00605 [Vicinamibacterales bacterium]|jgi:hypothetical protein|nr:hypothetical protein [Vicinamibacterales bacterium]